MTIEFVLSDEGDTECRITNNREQVEPKACIAEMLMRMYMMWVKNTGYKIKELNFQKESAGIKTVTLEFEGDYSLAI
jgi:peptide chain release factor 2